MVKKWCYPGFKQSSSTVGLEVKIGRIYWCLVDVENSFDPLDRENLW
jgi:hypothetical protein